MLLPFALTCVFMVAITTPGLIALHIEDRRKAQAESRS